jgi:response regulator RpfG family c-di-GMP phosphodiesterase/tRNA A-37 threonylcarbamoyl transferase component Bud32
MPPTTTALPNPRPIGNVAPSSSVQGLFRELLAMSLILDEDWEQLDPARRSAVAACRDEEELFQKLVALNLLNGYQAARVRARKAAGLTLGNYRVLDRIGAGGMGIVYLAEHTLMRRRVAIKTLSLTPDQDQRLVNRFRAEMRAIGKLQHPNIVAAIDAGTVVSTDPDTAPLHYFVMEHIPGQDLEALVHAKGPLAPERACQMARQIADALHEAHGHRLVHRDIKPSNVLLTPEDSAKLLDFGLARAPWARMTEPGSVLGTLGYMAPEQARDSTTVDERADIYSLGATLFWALTGQDPFAVTSNVATDLNLRLNQPPPSARAIRPEVPEGLDAVVRKMMAVAQDERYQTAEAVMRALLPFTESRPAAASAPVVLPPLTPVTPTNRRQHRVLIADDEAGIRTFCALALRADAVECQEVADGLAALEVLADRPFDLLLLDIDMPRLNGIETLKRVRQSPQLANLKVVMFSGRTAADDMAHLLQAGADDFLPKPFSITQLRARVKAQLRLKEAQDRTELLHRHLLTVNAELERSLTAKDGDLIGMRDALILTVAKLVDLRSTESEGHLLRMKRYCRVLGEEAIRGNDFGQVVDETFVAMLEACSPLHDIGKVGLPDTILRNPGKLDAEQRLHMQSHTEVAAEELQKVAKKQGIATGFFAMAADVARSHHERWDGTGYPDHLAGDAIPLAARFLAIADVYDALRSRRMYKPALPHHTAVMTITEGSPGHFDPKVIAVFRRCLPQFDQAFREFAE